MSALQRNDAGPERGALEAVTVDELRKLVEALRQGRSGTEAINLDSDLDRDLGLDSLARAELIARLSRRFSVDLPEPLLGEARTPRDLIDAILAAEPRDVGEAMTTTATPSHPVEEPVDARTLIEALALHAARHGAREHVLLWRPDDTPEPLTYGALYAEALRVAGGLVELGVSPRDRVAIMLATGRDFFVAFCGVLIAGAVPVPIYPPFRLARIEDHLRRQAGILNNAGAVALIASREIMAVGQLLIGLVGALEHLTTVERLSRSRPLFAPFPAAPDALALVQYTSGSTGDPKGVMLTHANLLANIRSMGAAVGASSSDRVVSWLPLYHDMGLIGCWLGSLYYGAPALIMSPLSFLTEPARWLRAIHAHRATISAAPNFAYEFCLKSIDEKQIKNLDLSSLRALLNGAEPVSATTMMRFLKTFAANGLRPDAVMPVYGLAENAVGLAFPPRGRGLFFERIERRALDRDGVARVADDDARTAMTLVACGRPIPGHEIRVVDDVSRELPERYEGRIEFRGPSATKGYYNNPEKTQALFDGEWIDTGDRGYIAGGDLFITGRAKDLIKRGGRNIYPQELEEAVGAISGARKGCVAVFPTLDPRTGSERLIVMTETSLTDEPARDSLRKRIDDVTRDLLDFAPDETLLVAPHVVPKTSSGKVRRSAARALFEKGLIEETSGNAYLQILRLALAGFEPRLRRFAGRIGGLAYGAYFWCALAIITLWVWPVVVFAPLRRWRHAMLGAGARLFFRIVRIELKYEEETSISKMGVIVVNHSSYLDGAVICALCSGELTFIAKEELAGYFFAGLFLRRLGTIFVRRSDPAGGVADARRVVEEARAGARIVWFPEGTFSRMPGLLPFHLGAFTTAVELGLPVFPLAIRGTRSILRSGSWLSRRGGVIVHASAPVTPSGSDFVAAVALRDRVRAEILAHCGEPDLCHERIMLRPD